MGSAICGIKKGGIWRGIWVKTKQWSQLYCEGSGIGFLETAKTLANFIFNFGPSFFVIV